jgi:cytochrome bd ubiquinol oxidase subunit II
LLVLFLLIVRVVSFEWRDKSDSARWRRVWMWANAAGSTGIALIWGIALANLIHGVPIDSEGNYTGTFWDLFSVYTVLAGIAFVLLFAFHGASYLTLRTSGDLLGRARRAARTLGVPAIAVGAAFLIWTVVVAVDQNHKGVFPPVLPAVIAIGAFALAGFFVYTGRSGFAFVMTALGTLAAVATLFTGLYPRVMVSSSSFGNSLSVSNAASVHYTLVVLTVVALVLMPLVLLYQTWSYYVFRARVGGQQVRLPGDAAAQPTAGPGPA